MICSCFTSQLCRALNIPCTKWCGSSKSSKGSGWKIFSIIAQQWEEPQKHFAAVEVLCRAQLAKCTGRMYTESGVGPLWLQTGKTSPPLRELPLWDTAPNMGVRGSEPTADHRKNLRGCLLPMARHRQKNGHHLTEAISSQHPQKIKKTGSNYCLQVSCLALCNISSPTVLIAF